MQQQNKIYILKDNTQKWKTKIFPIAVSEIKNKLYHKITKIKINLKAGN